MAYHHSPVPGPSAKVSVAYYVNWAIYQRQHFPWEPSYQHLTHVLYSFANVRPETGQVYLTDAWSDEQIQWKDGGASWNDSGTNLYGCLNQFRRLKHQHRHLKLILSIGGWTFSSNFAPAASSEAKRQTFADSCSALIEDYGLDGVDIDWEYPRDEKEADHYVDLLKRTRSSLDALAEAKGEKDGYLLTIAAPCGKEHYSKLKIAEMDRYLSFWNLMAYDFAGSWDSKTGHQANLWPSNPPPNQGNFSVDASVSFYTSHVHPSKIVLGMPLYGRSFASTSAHVGHPFAGVGQGTWEAGTYDYKTLPKPNTQLHENLTIGAATSWDPTSHELVSFDTPTVALMKADYIVNKQLGGAMWWETSGDHSDPAKSLIALVAQKIGPLDSSRNHVWFPKSKWDNLKSFPRMDQAPSVPLDTKPISQQPNAMVFQGIQGGY